MSKSDFPPVPKVLLEALAKQFPNTIPTGFESIEVIRKLQGQQDVIRFLRTVYDKQTQSILE